MDIIRQIIQAFIADPFLLIVTFFGIGGLLTFFQQRHQRALAHRERMAEIEARKETAKALAAAPEEAQRSELAKQLLEAYGEAGEGLRNDEKGSLVRWELSKSDD
jgi:hypothetical protein